MPDVFNSNPKGAIVSQSKHGTAVEELSKGAVDSQSKQGDVEALKDGLYLSIAPSLAAEQFYRITEQGAFRILEENLDLRIIENAP